MSSPARAALAASTLAGYTFAAGAAVITSISFPDSVNLSTCTTLVGPRSVTAPFDYSGIGNIINPSVAPPGSSINPADFTLHQTIGTVNLNNVVVTYEFDAAVLIDAFDVVQHHNGVRTFEVLVGDSLDSMTSIGTTSMPENETEYLLYRFEYDTSLAGKLVQLRVAEPELPGQGGWAFYRAHPIYSDVPAPSALGLTPACLLLVSRRRR
ncbi:MAG: hypothetical protein H6810_04180 [Phycisphaeraceae bacterium]|nr:MAG: hypothetical protein H6810_04180 [Phycisphaeraceae bacterium]